jgi:hypothetical protein
MGPAGLMHSDRLQRPAGLAESDAADPLPNQGLISDVLATHPYDAYSPHGRTVTTNMNWKHFAVAVSAALSIGAIVALVGVFAGLSSMLIAPLPVVLSHR